MPLDMLCILRIKAYSDFGSAAPQAEPQGDAVNAATFLR